MIEHVGKKQKQLSLLPHKETLINNSVEHRGTYSPSSKILLLIFANLWLASVDKSLGDKIKVSEIEMKQYQENNEHQENSDYKPEG